MGWNTWLASVAPDPSSPSPQIVVLIGIAHMLVIYRAVAMALFTQSEVNLLSKHANIMAVMTGAVLHYITIIIMTKVRSHMGCLAGFLHGQPSLLIVSLCPAGQPACGPLPLCPG